jgi:hypothetical protein
MNELAKIDSFRQEVAVAESIEALINYFNLPKFCLPNIQELRLF